MKKYIKRWLGIERIESKNKDLDEQYRNLTDVVRAFKIDTRSLIGEAFKDVLNNNPDSHWGWSSDGLNNKFIKVLNEASKEPAKKIAIDMVNSEEFLDKIVDRILKKQLK